MKKAKLEKRLNEAMEHIWGLERENEALRDKVAAMVKENEKLQRQLDELSDERKLKEYIDTARQLHGIAAHKRNLVKDHFKYLYRKLEEAEKATFETLDSIGDPVYRAL